MQKGITDDTSKVMCQKAFWPVSDIKVNHVIIERLMICNVNAERVQMAQHADFSGDLCCAGIAVYEGAKIQASFSRD